MVLTILFILIALGLIYLVWSIVDLVVLFRNEKKDAEIDQLLADRLAEKLAEEQKKKTAIFEERYKSQFRK